MISEPPGLSCWWFCPSQESYLPRSWNWWEKVKESEIFGSLVLAQTQSQTGKRREGHAVHPEDGGPFWLPQQRQARSVGGGVVKKTSPIWKRVGGMVRGFPTSEKQRTKTWSPQPPPWSSQSRGSAETQQPRLWEHRGCTQPRVGVKESSGHHA